MDKYRIKCPQCSNIIEYESNLEFMFCKYCGKKLYRSNITLRSNITSTNDKDEAQVYYERWINLFNKRNSNPDDTSVSIAFEQIDKEFNMKYCNDYRRLYCDVIVLTQNFKGITTYDSYKGYHDYEDPLYEYFENNVETYIQCGGLSAKDKLITIKNEILRQSNSKLALDMASRIEKHINEVILVAERQIINHTRSGRKNVIKVETRKEYEKRNEVKEYPKRKLENPSKKVWEFWNE